MAELLRFEGVQVGDELPAFITEPVSRLMLALYCGASGDHNPIHVDTDFARAAGQADVFAHGMLSMAWLARVLTSWVPQAALRELNVRFVAITHLGERIRCSARVVEKMEEPDGQRLVRLQLETRNEAGELKLTGDAVVVLP